MKKILQILILIGCLSTPAVAATFNIPNGDVAALIAAINTANSNGETDIINLAASGIYNLSAVHNTISDPNIGGGNGLPGITNDFAGAGADVTFNGNGATIQRNMAGNLRLLVIRGSGTEVVINNVVFKNAKATLNGACIAAMWQKVRLTVNNCTFENNELTPTGVNTEDGGGAILIHEGFLTVNNSSFKGNSAPNGGAIKCLLSNMTLTNCTFENNSTTGTGNNGGAGVVVDGAFNDFLNQNTYNPARAIVIQQCKFLNNTDIKQGGGLFLYTYGIATATIDQCYFKGNTSPSGAGMHFGSDGDSGAICTITNTTFDSNISSGSGGGINYYSPNSNPTLNLNNCTIAFNIANGVGGSGGGIAAFGNPKLGVYNCTIAGNFTRGWGGGIANGTTTVSNSIIANNLATNADNLYSTDNQQKNCAGGNGFNAASPPSPYHSGGNNLEFPTRTSPGGGGLQNNAFCTGTTIEADPKLDNAVKDNGGVVPTLAILSGSAAINVGVGCTTLDQRGIAREGNCDIGAFEYITPMPVTLVNFAVNPDGNSAKIEWATATETNNSHFEVSRSTDGVSFVKIARVEGNGNRNSLSRYFAFDRNPANGINYYKLIQYDKDGTATEKGIKTLNFGLNNSRLVVYPNPTVDGKINIILPSSLNGQKKQIALVNLLGKILKKVELGGDVQSYTLDLAGIPEGVYFITINTGENKLTTKIIVR